MQRILKFDGCSGRDNIFGVEDKNLKVLEEKLMVELTAIPEGILIKGQRNKVDNAARSIKKIADLGKKGLFLNHRELDSYIRLSSSGGRDAVNGKGRGENTGKGAFNSSVIKRKVTAKTKKQESYVKAMQEYDIVFATGPAGTGKTYLAMAMAVDSLVNKKVQRIILTRPAIEAGESLGFLPGGMQEKLSPYLRPLYDALYAMLDTSVVENYLEHGVIEVLPLAYMRGRTLDNAFVILDEAQNCTSEQLKMFLTRLGFDSQAVITGDTTQSDLPGGKPSGLLETAQILRSIKGIKFVSLSKKDVVRHPLIQKIIKAYENLSSR